METLPSRRSLNSNPVNSTTPVLAKDHLRTMKKGARVRIVKLRAEPGGVPACPWPLYSGLAQDGILSLPVGYEMEGFLLDDLVYRGYIQLDRWRRNRVAVRGIFTSSRICRIAGDEVHTHNSIYRITVIESSETAMLGEKSAGTKSSRRLATPSLPRTDDT